MIRLRKGEIPILRQFQFSATECCVVPRRKFQNTTKHRLRVGHPKKRQILMERLGIERRFNFRNLQESFDFRSKCETTTVVKIVERLDSKMIARDKQRRYPGTQIAYGE